MTRFLTVAKGRAETRCCRSVDQSSQLIPANQVAHVLAVRTIAAISHTLVDKSLQRVRQRDVHGDGWLAQFSKLGKDCQYHQLARAPDLSFNSSDFQISPDSEPDGVASQATIQNVAETF